MSTLQPRQLFRDPTSTEAGGWTIKPPRVYPLAIIISMASLIIALAAFPPMLWHFRNRNFGATSLVAWVIVLLLMTFLNGILWPNDRIESWYNGDILCDVEVKLQVAAQVALPASSACVLRALARVMDTDRTSMTRSERQRIRDYAVAILLCVGAPLLQMLFHYVVQTHRYYIYGISGCVPAVSSSWVTILLLLVPPLAWTLLDAYYAVLIAVRLYRYRQTFSHILAASNTPKGRFMRLYVVCIVWIVGFVPLQSYILAFNASLVDGTYTWKATHDPEQWSQVVMTPSRGNVVYDRWIWITVGVLVFFFFGCGREALGMYKTGLVAMGFARCFPGLNQPSGANTSSRFSSTLDSFGSKAKSLFKKRSDGSVSMASVVSPTTTMTSDTNPFARDKDLFRDAEKGSEQPHPAPPSLATRIVSPFRRTTRQGFVSDHPGQSEWVKDATASSGPPNSSPTSHVAPPTEVIVRKEVKVYGAKVGQVNRP